MHCKYSEADWARDRADFQSQWDRMLGKRERRSRWIIRHGTGCVIFLSRYSPRHGAITTPSMKMFKRVLTGPLVCFFQGSDEKDAIV